VCVCVCVCLTHCVKQTHTQPHTDLTLDHRSSDPDMVMNTPVA
jgi:hypothetical protein